MKAIKLLEEIEEHYSLILARELATRKPVKKTVDKDLQNIIDKTEKMREVIKELKTFVLQNHNLKSDYDSLMKAIEKSSEMERELEELQERSCLTCKHIKGIKPKLGQTYCAIGIEDLNYDLGIKKDFCCNRYEAKEQL